MAVLSADRVVGALVLLKSVDLALRGPGQLPDAVWAVALAGWVAAGLALAACARVGRTAWCGLLLSGLAIAVDAPLELRRQHLVLLLGTALAAVVARTAGERLQLWRWQLTALYGTATLAKLNESFLGGDVLATALRDGPLPVVLGLPALVAAGLAVLAVEAVLAVTPWLARLRRPGTALAAVLHLAAVPLLAGDPLVGLRLVFFGGLAVLLHATSAGLLAVPERAQPVGASASTSSSCTPSSPSGRSRPFPGRRAAAGRRT